MVRVSNHGLVTRRLCTAMRADGQPCGMPPMAESEFCWAHDPASAEAAAGGEAPGRAPAQEGRSRRVARTASRAWITFHDIRRLIEIAVLDTLLIENSIQRSRALAYLAQTALRSLEVGEVPGSPSAAGRAGTGAADLPLVHVR